METREQRHKQVLDALAQYQAQGAVPAALARVLETESDRALVTILGSYVEDALLERIITELPSGGESRKALLKGGPLRSVEHRIALAKAMGILPDHHARLVNVVRAMRNACAHSRLDISLETPELRNALALLTPDPMAKTIVEGTNEGSLRGLFVAATTILLHWLTGCDAASLNTYAEDAKDGQGNIKANEVLLATLRGISKSKPAPDLRPFRKDKKP
jgi:hypothetical protein